MKKSKNADVLQDDLTAKSVSSKSPGGSFGTFDRQLARAMALCTRHYRVDWSLGIYDEAHASGQQVEGPQGARKFFLSEPKAVLRQFALAGPAGIRRARSALRPAQGRQAGAEADAGLRVEVWPGPAMRRSTTGPDRSTPCHDFCWHRILGWLQAHDCPHFLPADVLLAPCQAMRSPTRLTASPAAPSSPVSPPGAGPDHFLAMVSVGILSAQIGGRAIWTVPRLLSR